MSTALLQLWLNLLNKRPPTNGGSRFSMIKVANILLLIYDWLLLASLGINLPLTNRRVSESFYKLLRLPIFIHSLSSQPTSKAAMLLAQKCHTYQASLQIQAVNTRQASFISYRSLSRPSLFCISSPGGLTLPCAHTRPRGSTLRSFAQR